ncbi:MAG: hypothetical protein ACFFCI_06105 [Promethearchaeota archaeon]
MFYNDQNRFQCPNPNSSKVTCTPSSIKPPIHRTPKMTFHQKSSQSVLAVQSCKKVKYPIRKSDNTETRLVKRLFNLIYILESEIVEFEKSSKKCLNLTIMGGVKLRRFKGSIVASEITKILGVSLDIVKRWMYQLELSKKRPINLAIRPKSIKTISEHVEIFSNYKVIYASFLEVLVDYNKKECNDDFLNKLVFIFNRYIKGGGGKSWLSEILAKSRSYIFNLEHRRGERGRGGPEHYAKYFKLLTYIHLINKDSVNFKSGLKVNDLKAECRDLIFEEMKKRNMISELCESKYSGRIIKPDNRELFDIVIFSLLALTKIERNGNNQNDDFVYEYANLSRLISKKNSRDFLTGKFRKGYILAKTEAKRLIREIRRDFFKAPKESHDAIYMIKVHINNPHWREYEKHFIDLRRIQQKELLDLNLGLDIYERGFIEDAHPFVTKKGEIIEGRYVFYVTRHHLDEDQNHYWIFDYNSRDFTFKMVLLPSKSHWKLHANKEEFCKNKILLNARMKQLYRWIKLKSIPKGNYIQKIKFEFDKESIMINGQKIKIWNKFPKEMIEEWIRRWNARKILSDKEFYERLYPNFYNHQYEPLLNDISLFKNKDTKCKRPEFWYWYFKHYIKNNI